MWPNLGELEEWSSEALTERNAGREPMDVFHEDYLRLIGRLLSGEPLSFARFNDGEMTAIALGRRVAAGEVLPTHTFAVARGAQEATAALGKDLEDALASHARNLVLGVCCPACYSDHYAEAERLRDKRTPVVNTNVLQNGTWRLTRAVLAEVLSREKRRPFLWIGGADQSSEGVEMALGRRPEMITVPSRDAYSARDQILDAVLRSAPGGLVCLSCGPVSRLAAVRAAVEGTEATVLDVGSLLDPYTIGVHREYHLYQGPRCPLCAGPPIIGYEPTRVDRAVRWVRQFVPHPRELLGESRARTTGEGGVVQ
jgi:hypothetical protein